IRLFVNSSGTAINIASDYCNLSTFLPTTDGSGGTIKGGVIYARFIDPIEDGGYYGPPSKNTGFTARKKAFYNPQTGLYDRKVTLFLPITRIFKIFENNRRCVRGVKHTIRLDKNQITLNN